MTIDDDNSIYVGGFPYETTEETLRRSFDIFGSIVAIKIISDREVGGKCYGFVTFTNPRSAINAIADMNGRIIGGRVVRVNEVQSRGGRPTFHRDNFRRDAGRDFDWDRERDRERDFIRDRDRYRDRNTERSQDREKERERDNERGRDSERAGGHAYDRGRDLEDRDHERIRDHDRDWERDRDMDWDQDKDMDKTKDHERVTDKDKEQQSRNKLGARLSNRRSRELSSNSSDDHLDQVKEQLDLSHRRREELQNELTLIQEMVEEKEQLVSDLLKKSQKLEVALAEANTLSSERQLMLTKMHKCCLKAQEYNSRLKNSEQELQLLVDTTMDEVDAVNDANT